MPCSAKSVLNRYANDLPVIGHMPAGGHLGASCSGYAIIRDSLIPVLSV